MAAKVGQVVVNFLLNTAKFETDVKKITRSLNATARDFSNAGRAMTMGLTLPIVGAGAAAIKLAGEFMQTKIAFNTMLGSTEKSTKFLNDLRSFAAKTPFEFQDLTRAAKRMMALGFSAEQVTPTLTAIGDAVAGLGGGSEMIDRVTLALGQMQAKGKVSAQEMNQLAEAGIPAWKLLADRIGKSIPEAMKLAEKGAIASSLAIPAILAGMSEKFGGLMTKQNKTLLGQMSNLKDQFHFIVTDLGATLLPIATQVMDNFVKPLAKGIKDLVDWFASLSKENQALIIKTVALAAAVGPLAWAFGSLATGISSTLALSSRLLTLISGGGGLVGAVTNLGIAATGAGAVFAGWKIAEWIDKLDLFGRHAAVATNEIIKQAEGFRKEANDIGAIREAMAKYKSMLDSGIINQGTFNALLTDVEKQRLNETLEQYRDRMKAMVDQFKAAHPELFKAKDGLGQVGAAATAAALDLSGLTDATKDTTAEIEALADALDRRMFPVELKIIEFLREHQDELRGVNDALVENARLMDEQESRSRMPEVFDTSMMPENNGVMDGVNEISKAMDDYHQRLMRIRQSFTEAFYRDPVDAQLAAYQEYYAQLDELRANNLISEQEYSNAVANLKQQENEIKLSRTQSFFGRLSQMQSSHIRGIAAVGKAAAIAEATVNTYVGATKALAQGGTWGIINMAAVLAAGFAQVSSIVAQGFAKGGLVPGGERLIRVNEDGPETVMNARATREYGPLLEMLNSPRPINNRLETSPVAKSMAGAYVNVSIANYGTSKQFEVQHIDEATIRVIARDESYGVLSRRGPDVIAADLAYPNSRTSKAIAKHTTARRGDR